MIDANFFSNKIKRFTRVDPDTNCWIWLGAVTGKGYGHVRVHNQLYTAHRLSYAVHIDENALTTKLHVLHKCDNKSCCNPDHLFLGTNAENMQDKASKGLHHNQKKTHCRNGHEFTEENTYRWKTERQCRICRKAADDRHNGRL